MYRLLRPLFFFLSPEAAHHWVLSVLKWVPACFFPRIGRQPLKLLGLEFDNPIGLAAGLDKNGDHIDGLAKLGFGFIEVGSVTPRAQPGNAKPRLFRLKNSQALINRMGFNNKGVDYLVKRLQVTKYRGVIGVNIGKNLDTPVEKAVDDYLIVLRKVYEHASYLVINVSSPNTPNLRELQQASQLGQLLSRLKDEQKILAEKHQKYTPMLVKISPDESEENIEAMAQVILDNGIDGVIATNTSNQRHWVEGEEHASETGGLSGAPIGALSTSVISKLRQALGDELPIIGVGGIHDEKSAQEKFSAGANLIQVYTGLIYEGPGLLKAILASTLSRLRPSA